jgi:hypothetical protein
MKIITRLLLSILIAICFCGYVAFIEDRPLAPITQEDLETAAKQPSLAKEGVEVKAKGHAYRLVAPSVTIRHHHKIDGVY